MKIVTVIGARPQFIKAAALSRVLLTRPGVQERVVHTGQHFDANMSRVFFDELEIPEPAYHLGLTAATHGAMTGRMLEGIEAVLLAEKPDWVLVYGDTNSTLAGALAAAKLHVPVAHVEAGLRSFNRGMPEEINRVMTDHLSDLLFAPTRIAVDNLSKEGVTGDQVALVGDVMADASRFFSQRAERESDVLERLGLRSGGYALATIHRAENTDDPARLTAIFGGLLALAAELPVVVPLHPRTRQVLERLGLLAETRAGLLVVDPLGFLDMVRLEKHARMIATDSGGVQKEAFFYQVPCLTLRDETEWVELVELGWNTLCSPRSVPDVTQALRAVLQAQPAIRRSPYGDGYSAERIADTLARFRLKRPESVA